MRGTGRATFAAVLLLIVGALNVVFGFGALAGANVFLHNQRYILTNLNTLGWVMIVLGAVQWTGAFALMRGSTYGRIVALTAAGLGAIGAVLSIGGSDPWWSLAIFALCLYVIHGLFMFGEDTRASQT